MSLMARPASSGPCSITIFSSELSPKLNKFETSPNIFSARLRESGSRRGSGLAFKTRPCRGRAWEIEEEELVYGRKRGAFKRPSAVKEDEKRNKIPTRGGIFLTWSASGVTIGTNESEFDCYNKKKRPLTANGG